MSLIVSIFPIVLLIYLMTRKNSVPSQIALPVVAGITLVTNGLFLKMPVMELAATAVDGLLTALTPVVIITGAIFLFKTMEKTGALDVIRDWLNNITVNKVGQLMIIGWAFCFLIEGASGFGTPAALAAPILAGLGFNPLSAALFTLVMNSVPVSFGAVGTPTWFGFSGLSISAGEIAQIGIKSAVIHFAAALVIPVIGLRLVIDWKSIRKNIGFIYISILSCTVPYLLVALFNYEFPALLGGFTGFIASIMAAKNGWGLEPEEAPPPFNRHSFAQLVKALFPLWGTLLVLVVTRIPQLGLKGLLTKATPEWALGLGPLGTASLSPGLVIKLKSILGTPAVWEFKALYVPGIIPFFLVAAIAFWLYRSGRKTIGTTVKETLGQMRNPFIALLGALVLVNLLMMGGEKAPTMQIGVALSEWFGWGWRFFAPFLGALGSFFSGSNTISNLTFAPIQDAITGRLGLERTTVLAAQSVGGAMGNMVCINNIVAVCSVLGLSNVEGKILKKTVMPMLVYGIIAGTLSLII